MPNWCSNELRVDVDNIDMSLTEWLNEVGDLKKDDDGKVIMNDDGLPEYFKLDFNKIIPEPDYENENGWYGWRLNNWGTKWNCDGEYSSIFYYDETSCEFTIYTAWAPPEGIMDKLNEKYEDIQITLFYREDGNQIAGYL